MPRQFVLNSTVTERQFAEIRRIAQDRGVTVSHVMREVLDTWLATAPSNINTAAPPKDGHYTMLDAEVQRTRAVWKPLADRVKRNQPIDADSLNVARLAYESALSKYREANSA